MHDKLLQLTEADIRARSAEASFKRGQNYYTNGAIKRRIRHETSLETEVIGTQIYQVTVWVAADRVKTTCTCPYDQGGDCKHIVATLLAWLHEPDSFQPPVDLNAVLNRRSKAELVSLLLDILAVYPHLVDDFEIVTGPNDQNLEEQVAKIFEELEPWGHLTEKQAAARMRLIAHRADRLAEQGQTDLARRTYYALVSHCVGMGKSYGSYDFFPTQIYDFAVAYSNLAMDQVAEQRATIEAELREIYRDLNNPDMLGLDEALSNVWDELGLDEV